MGLNKHARMASAFLLFMLSMGVATPYEGNGNKIAATGLMSPGAIDVKHIVIDLLFDWDKKQAYGTTDITFSLLTDGDAFLLDAGMLTIYSIVLPDGTPLKFDYDGSDKNDGLKIFLPKVYPAGKDITVKINYHTNYINESDPNNLGGSYGKGIRFFRPTFTEPEKRLQVWTNGEPESNRYWFPCNDSPGDIRTTEFIATVDEKLTVVSNGRLIDTKSNADSTRTFRWKMDVPYANYQTSFVIGEYTDVEQNYNGVQLHSMGYPDEKEAVAASVVRLPDMIKFFSERTGTLYPYPAYTQVFVQELPNWSGNATTSTITENMIDDYGTHADFFYLWDLTEAEAVAHQWFGNYLSCSDWSDIWLTKSFCRYFSSLYDEYKNGRDEFLLYVHLFDQSTYLGDWNAGIQHPVVTKKFESAASFTGDNYAYYHGANVLHMLRKHLGDENWWKAIQLYVTSNANKPVSTIDFRNAVEKVTGESMGWFFDQWVYKMGHPVFEITKQYDAPSKKLTLQAKQIQKNDESKEYPQSPFFKGKVDIEIDGRIEQVWLEAKPENVFTFTAAQEPRLVHFDFESTWIKEITFKKTLSELLYQLENDKDILGRNWALGQLSGIAKDSSTSVGDKIKIQASFRNVIEGNAYWRFRYTALLRLQNLLAPSWQTKPVQLDEATTATLLRIIQKDKSWNRAAAISFLGMTRNAKYAPVYLNALNDESDRVINAAANALGKSKSPTAFNALIKLKDKPSWKNQSLISCLNGLKELGDPRGFDVAFKALSDRHSPHWTLATPVWDYRIAAAETIVGLGKSNAAYSLITERFKKSLADNDVNDIFSNVLLITTLADARSQVVFDDLKVKFKDNTDAMAAINQYETQFKSAVDKATAFRNK